MVINMIMISIMDIPREGQHEHAHRLLGECLSKLDISSDVNSMAIGEHGKPYLVNYPDVHFNLTHSNGIAACIVSRRECGIDAERVRKCPEKVLRRVFSEREKRTIEGLPYEERDLYFFRLWTLKEAYVKMLGIGISYPMREVEFNIENGCISANIDDCRFTQHILDGGEYVVSVCVRNT